MKFRTLGGLAFGESPFHREKPLVLAAFLAIEGARSRRDLAVLFWPEASDPLNSLSVALRKLRHFGIADGDEAQVWIDEQVQCDAVDLRAHLRAERLREAVESYTGTFLEGAALTGFGEELEEWVYTTRESLAAATRWAMLRVAESDVKMGQVKAAAELAERAYQLAGAPPIEPELLPRLYALLANHPLGERVRREAQELGLPLAAVAPSSAPPAFLGRTKELSRLLRLAPGEWAWVRGASGMGKTALLNYLKAEVDEGSLLPGRHGLPYVTLEPLLGPALADGLFALMQRLRVQPGFWLIDNWEAGDEESWALLRTLRALGTKARIVIASSLPPEVPVEVSLALGPLGEDELRTLPGAYERTGGVPALVGALLRGEELGSVLINRIDALPRVVQEVCASLIMAGSQRTGLARRALGLNVADFHQGMETLIQTGLLERDGTVRAGATAEHWLDERPVLTATVALRLAPLLPPLEAFPLYERAGALGQTPQAQEALLAWARELLRRGFPERAALLLREASTDEALGLLARALEVAGRFQEALDVLEHLPNEGDLLGLKATLLWHVGQPEEARIAAQMALAGSTAARAEGLNTLGKVAVASGQLSEAVSHFRRAAALWRTVGDGTARRFALNNLGVALLRQGVHAEDAFREALSAAQGHPAVLSMVLLNVGKGHEREGHPDRAAVAYERAAHLASEVGARDTLALAWINLGVLHHVAERAPQAREAYERAVEVARASGDARSLGLVLGNLAELDEDEDAWEEAILLLERAGHLDLRSEIQENLEAFRARSGGRAQG